jgi:hypothetical protein
MFIELRKYLVLNQRSLMSKLGWNLPEKICRFVSTKPRLGATLDKPETFTFSARGILRRVWGDGRFTQQAESSVTQP